MLLRISAAARTVGKPMASPSLTKPTSAPISLMTFEVPASSRMVGFYDHNKA
jgi:hypothetical protein